MMTVVAAVLAWQSGANAVVEEYQVNFDMTWSFQTHPTAWPTGAHFSAPVGGTHNANVTFWEAGGLATNGIEVMAETGSTSPLRSEVQAAIAAGDAFDDFSDRSFNSPGGATFRIDVDDAFPLVTITSMVAPSPDWFVGVSSVPLREAGQWVPLIVLPLHPYDAGTDSGTNFRSLNQNTNPAEPIRRLDTDPTSLLFGTGPMGTVTIEHIPAGSLEGDADRDGDVDDGDLSLLLANWNRATHWGNGEFSGAAPVNDTDLSLLLSNWTGPLGSAAPEPASAVMMLLGVSVLAGRRRG